MVAQRVELPVYLFSFCPRCKRTDMDPVEALPGVGLGADADVGIVRPQRLLGPFGIVGILVRTRLHNERKTRLRGR